MKTYNPIINDLLSWLKNIKQNLKIIIMVHTP